MSGLKIAALYGFRPHSLGLCGPKEALQQGLLRKFLRGKLTHAQILPVLKKFKGAYPYYRLIAAKNTIKTGPFSKRVIEAYWIGNELLDQVSTKDLQQMIVKSFSGPGLFPKEIAAKKAALIPENSKPHHSFHVLTIGSVTGSVDFKNTKLKDLCRVGWGSVIKFNPPTPLSKGGTTKNTPLVKGGEGGLNNNKLIIEYSPLVGEKKIKLGKAVKKEIFWDKILIPDVKIGDWVSFHWNYAVQILTEKDIANLKKYTQSTLDTL